MRSRITSISKTRSASQCKKRNKKKPQYHLIPWIMPVLHTEYPSVFSTQYTNTNVLRNVWHNCGDENAVMAWESRKQKNITLKCQKIYVHMALCMNSIWYTKSAFKLILEGKLCSTMEEPTLFIQRKTEMYWQESWNSANILLQLFNSLDNQGFQLFFLRKVEIGAAILYFVISNALKLLFSFSLLKIRVTISISELLNWLTHFLYMCSRVDI